MGRSKITDSINRLAKSVGYVYVIHYINGRENLFKVGVSDNPDIRIRGIKGSLPGEVVEFSVFPVWEPYLTEKTIHNWWSENQKTPKGATSRSGGNEFFIYSRARYYKTIAFLFFKECIFRCFEYGGYIIAGVVVLTILLNLNL